NGDRGKCGRARDRRSRSAGGSRETPIAGARAARVLGVAPSPLRLRRGFWSPGTESSKAVFVASMRISPFDRGTTMRRAPHVLILAAAAVPTLFSLGCESSRSTMPAAADARASSTSPSLDRNANLAHAVALRDDCDPASFDAATGPGACVRNGNGMPFGTFIDVLTQNQSVGAWKIDPDQVELAPGSMIVATNR